MPVDSSTLVDEEVPTSKLVCVASVLVPMKELTLRNVKRLALIDNSRSLRSGGNLRFTRDDYNGRRTKWRTR